MLRVIRYLLKIVVEELWHVVSCGRWMGFIVNACRVAEALLMELRLMEERYVTQWN